MNQLSEKTIECPYCGETLEVLIDPVDAGQQYIEDCQVCCKPINFVVTETMDGDLTVSVFSDDEAF
ncbi:CPXCG motif-containing cysteine-rich protein [Reinekea sp.]|uniref:CPXCG motif-containing cysteine-rich protein n=1 Tax=Reinekea sp. TaxID=1970455 RepID=UPI003988EFAA